MEHIVTETVNEKTVEYDLTEPEALYDFLVREIHAKEKPRREEKIEK